MKKRRHILFINKSLKHIFAQVTDANGIVLAATTTKTLPTEKQKKLTKTEQAELAAKNLAEQLNKKKITWLRFNRKGQRYHGRIAAFIETLRKQNINL